MKANEKSEDAKTVGAVTHTHTHTRILIRR